MRITNKEKDAMFAKMITSDNGLLIEELNDFLIIQKIFELIKNKNPEN